MPPRWPGCSSPRSGPPGWPSAGTGRRPSEQHGLVAKAVRRGIGCVILREGDDLRAIAEREIADGATAIGMAGGDGTLAWAATWFRVDSAGSVPVGVDGEALRFDPPLEFTTLPGALRVRLAPAVVAPAAGRWRPGAGETVRTLLRVIANRQPANRQPANRR